MPLWPYFLLMGVMFATAAIWSARSRFYGTLLAADGAGERSLPLDGLRGYLACSVVVCHAASFYFHYQRGGWGWPPSQFYTLLGQVPVALFFMITGYLFWAKALRGPVRPIDHYARRFWRVAPLYGLLVALVLAVVAVESRGRLMVGPSRLAIEVAKLCVPGLKSWPTINGRDVGQAFTVTWTLWYEGLFYLVLPAIALLASRRGFALLAAAVGGGYVAARGTPALHTAADAAAMFLCGMAVAQAQPLWAGARRWPKTAGSIVAGGCIVGVLALAPTAYAPAAYLPLAAATLCIANGSDLFGLLTWRPARMLGTLSYSIYLMHMLVMYVLLGAFNRAWSIASMSPAAYWAISCAMCAAAIGVSAITYRYFEHPFFGRGRWAPRGQAMRVRTDDRADRPSIPAAPARAKAA